MVVLAPTFPGAALAGRCGQAIGVDKYSHPEGICFSILSGRYPTTWSTTGAPPAYYVMLHYWLQLFGRSGPGNACPLDDRGPARNTGRLVVGRQAFRAESGPRRRGAVATGADLWTITAADMHVTCGWRLRPYSRSPFRPGLPRGRASLLGAATALMAAALYFQYYGLYLFAATVIAGSAAALGRRSRPHLKATWLFYAWHAGEPPPWAPQFLCTSSSTQARPWAPTPPCSTSLLTRSTRLGLGGLGAAIVVAVAVCVINRPLSATPTSKPVWLVTSPVALSAGVPLITLLLAWTVGQFVNSWNPRYLGIAVVPALIPLAGGLSRARWGTARALGAIVALACTAIPMVVDRGVTVETSKSNVAYLFSELQPLLRPGALVISSEVTDTPVLALDLGDRYRYATPSGNWQTRW